MTLTVSLRSTKTYRANLIIFISKVEEKITKTLDNIIEVKGKVKSEITIMKEKLKLARETIGRFKTELAKLPNQPSQ